MFITEMSNDEHEGTDGDSWKDDSMTAQERKADRDSKPTRLDRFINALNASFP